MKLKGEPKTHLGSELCGDELLPVGTIHVFVRSSDPPNAFEHFRPEGIDFEGKDGPFTVVHVDTVVQFREMTMLEADAASDCENMTG